MKSKTTKTGYVKVKVPVHPNADKTGFVFEHRIIVEKKIGRYLNTEEKIHHIDLDKKNNKIENLMLFPTQSDHMKFHLKIQQFGMTNNINRQIANRWKNIK